jgi:hypothetical protein
MLQYEIDHEAGLVIVRFTGQVVPDDFQNVAPIFFEDVRSSGFRKVLLDYSQEEGARSKLADAMSYAAWNESRALFDKIAIVKGQTEAEDVDGGAIMHHSSGGIFP